MDTPPATEPALPETDRTQVDLAVLDAPVLLKGRLTLFLLHLAAAGAFDPIWSDQIHADWTREQQRLGQSVSAERLRQRRQALDQAFPVANVVASRDVLDEVVSHCATPAERKTAHVLATALAARASVIVSDSSFCLAAVMGKLWHEMVVVAPDAWCGQLLERHRELVLAGGRAHRARSGLTVDAWLAALASDLPATAARLAEARDRL